MLGFLVIFIDGYVTDGFSAHGLNHPNMSWDGWAVGEHRPCSRHSVEKLRRFNDYDEAVQDMFQRSRKRPQETYSLRYIRPLAGGGYEINPVSSLDEIEKLDQDWQNRQANVSASNKTLRDDLFPFFDELETLLEPSKVMKASGFVRELKQNGHAAVRAEMGSSYSRKIKELRALAVSPELGAILDKNYNGASV